MTAQQVAAASEIPVRFISADDPEAHGRVWLQQQWELARVVARRVGSIVVDKCLFALYIG
jgi:hypothetical protein